MHNKHANSLIYSSLLISATIFCHNTTLASQPRETLDQYTKRLQATVTRENAQDKYEQSIRTLKLGLAIEPSNKQEVMHASKLILKAYIILDACHDRGADIMKCFDPSSNHPYHPASSFCNETITYFERCHNNPAYLKAPAKSSLQNIKEIIDQQNMLYTRKICHTLANSQPMRSLRSFFN